LVHANATLFFPPNSLHLAAVDSGVGKHRHWICGVTLRGQFILPDLGLVSLARRKSQTYRAIRFSNSNFLRNTVAQTFCGRDIVTSWAGRPWRCTSGKDFGPSIKTMIRLPREILFRIDNGMRDAIEVADAIGILLRNVTMSGMPPICEDSFISV
jgi:S-adenosyl-L-methionine hydrolase (adenosine-forming)